MFKIFKDRQDFIFSLKFLFIFGLPFIMLLTCESPSVSCELGFKKGEFVQTKLGRVPGQILTNSKHHCSHKVRLLSNLEKEIYMHEKELERYEWKSRL